jgi:pSer/pThr/pTyr-binding forkhead associated (FHA) protein
MSKEVKFYNHTTRKISSETIYRMTRSIHTNDNDARIEASRELVLVVRGVIERLNFPENKTLFLGRGVHENLIDLSPYGAADRGVSRRHARFHIEGDYLYVTDLESTNGTYLAGRRLDPHVPTRVHKDDDLMLGNLQIKVLFR